MSDMTRRCRLCNRSIEGYPSAARYCKDPDCLSKQAEFRRIRKRTVNRQFMRRTRAERHDQHPFMQQTRAERQARREALRGHGLRFCRCGNDISHRSVDQAYCEACTGLEWKLNQKDALEKEIHQLHEIDPIRWPPEVLAQRYQLPLEQVQEWVTA